MSSNTNRTHSITVRNHTRNVSIWLLVLEICIVLLAPFVAPHDPYQHHPQQRFSPPNGTFLLGTDHLGRDILSRIIFGGREMLFTLLIAISISLLIGGGLGMISAISPFRADYIITLLVDISLSIPIVLLAILFIGIFGASLVVLALTLAAIFVPVFARQLRSLIQEALAHPSIAIVRIAGGSTWYVLVRHILPAIRAQLVHFVVLVALLMISIAAALSFLGLARRPPLADWGLMLRDARSYLFVMPWMSVAPGMALCITALLLYFVGRTKDIAS